VGALARPVKPSVPAPGGTGTRADRRFDALLAIVLLLVAAQASNDRWVGDFWEHAAAVRALAVDLLHPHHALLAIDTPHVFYSPYALGLALLVRLTGASPVTVLGLAGLVNVALFGLALRGLVAHLLGERAAFWSLLFALVLWGRDVWPWSGFVHLGVLGWAAPYPSCFAGGLSLVAIRLQLRALDAPRPFHYPLLGLLAAVVLITHPPTASALLAGVGACHLARGGPRPLVHGAALGTSLAAAAALASAWPYYPWVALVTTRWPEFDQMHRIFYEDVLRRVGPCLLGLPLLVLRARHRPRDVLLPWAVLLAAVYGWGFVSGSYGHGRAIGWIGFLLQLALAEGVARLEELWSSPVRRRMVAIAALLVALLFVPRAALERSRPGQRPVRPWVPVLQRLARGDDVVLADFAVNLEVPAYAGKVVAWPNALYWVSDHAERRADLARFFRAGTDLPTRWAIIRRHRVRFVALGDRAFLDPADRAAIASLGRILLADGPFLVVDLGEPSPARSPFSMDYEQSSAGTAGR
jgi:hypothetical protein